VRNRYDRVHGAHRAGKKTALCDAYRLLMARGAPPSRLWAAGYLAPERRHLSGICKNMDSGDYPVNSAITENWTGVIS
jgi:hypothetical protein